MELKEPLVVRMSRAVYNKMMGYVQVCPQEISGFGRTTYNRNVIVVNDVFLIEQTVNPVTTTMDPDALYEAIMEQAALGKDTSDWGLWWHSHVNMTARFSGTDIDTIERLGGEKPLVSIVTNKRHERFVQVDLHKPIRLSFENVPLEIVDPIDTSILTECQAEMREKVRMTTGGVIRPSVVTDPAQSALASVVRPYSHTCVHPGCKNLSRHLNKRGGWCDEHLPA